MVIATPFLNQAARMYRCLTPLRPRFPRPRAGGAVFGRVVMIVVDFIRCAAGLWRAGYRTPRPGLEPLHARGVQPRAFSVRGKAEPGPPSNVR